MKQSGELMMANEVVVEIKQFAKFFDDDLTNYVYGSNIEFELPQDIIKLNVRDSIKITCNETDIVDDKFIDFIVICYVLNTINSVLKNLDLKAINIIKVNIDYDCEIKKINEYVNSLNCKLHIVNKDENNSKIITVLPLSELEFYHKLVSCFDYTLEPVIALTPKMPNLGPVAISIPKSFNHEVNISFLHDKMLESIGYDTKLISLYVSSGIKFKF